MVADNVNLANSPFSWVDFFVTTYWLIAIGLFVKTIVRLIDSYYGSNQEISKIGNFRLFLTKNESFSLINRIFLNENDKNESLIVDHELAHLRQYHWIDLLFTELLKAILWINPLVWRWSILVKQNHEFLADANVARTYEFGKSEYVHLLLDKAFNTNQFSLGNYFSMHSLISKRINMLNKTRKQNSWTLGFLSFGVLLMAIGVASCAKSKSPEREVEKIIEKRVVNNNTDMELVKGAEEDFSTIESDENGNVEIEIEEFMPSFQGGQEELVNYMGNNTNYPKSCKEKNIEGKVIVSFIVDTEGKVGNVKVVKSVQEDMDAEAVRVISSMPNWNPGTVNGQATKMELKMPVLFKMS